ncbi:MAG: electron transfer flavoprotein subunit beta/FixA family protein [Desulfobacterales bacterium]|nr:electron transfer flavoprotein subunit beta/FixA family protein [Desulfobacterales bacterium]
MHIIVCVKQVLDPEARITSFRIDPASNTMALPQGVPPVISSFDECALEAALRIKDALDCKISVLSLGVNLRRDVVKKPLAMGADELVLLEDKAFAGSDSWSCAYALSMAIRKIGDFDLILCGRQSSDRDAGQVGSGIAELLHLPSVTVARNVTALDGKIRVERVTDAGYEVLEVPLPALVTVSSELGQPRYPTIKGIMSARHKETTIWKPADIGVTSSQVGAAGRRTRLVRLFKPVREERCEIVEGDSAEESGVNLALKLRGAKVL